SIPSTWSACRWVSTSSGTDRTPSRRKHPSTAVGSGPVSTTIATPAPASTTSASPWPTEQATNSQPGGGQPDETAASGACAARVPTETSQRTGTPASHASHPAATSDTGETTAASTPSTVAGATAGSASRFAGIETRLTVPLIAAMIGAVATVAAAGTASASATPGGIRWLRNHA